MNIYMFLIIIIISIKIVIINADLLNSPLFDIRPESESLQEIKEGLNLIQEKKKLEENAEQKNEAEAEQKNEEEAAEAESKETKEHDSNLQYIRKILSKFLVKLKRKKRKAPSKQSNQKPIYHKWTDWSKCSVTCGKGRVIRWRHCRSNCHDVETEMEEMSCQLPECARKLFGIIKLR